MRWTKGEMVFAAALYVLLLWLASLGLNWFADVIGADQRASLKWMLLTPLIGGVMTVCYFAIVAAVKRVARAVLHPRLYESLVRERGAVHNGQGQRTGTPTDTR